MTKSIQPVEELIRGCLKNERKAQMAIYDRYCNGMYVIAKRYAEDSLQAEDWTQEAFVKAFLNLKHYREEASFGAWLKRILINHCLSQKRLKKIEFVTLEETMIESKIEQSEIFSEKVKSNDLQNALIQLKENYRVVLSLFLFEGYDHSEIAQILTISEENSRALLSRGKRQLKSILLNQVAKP